MANAFRANRAVTGMNLRNVPPRWSSSLVAVLGIGGVTLVLIALLSIAAGFRVALEGSGSDDVAIVHARRIDQRARRGIRRRHGHGGR